MLHIQKEAALRPLFACGAYENTLTEIIGRCIEVKLLILVYFRKNGFRGFPRNFEIISTILVLRSDSFCIFADGTKQQKLWQ